MPFFIRKRPGSGPSSSTTTVKTKGEKKGKGQASEQHAKKRRFGKDIDVELSDANDENEEIPSDEENIGPIDESDSEFENETPHEKRLRLAKEYLSQVEAEVKDDLESDDDDGSHLVAKRLQDDVKQMSGKHFTLTAHEILEPQPEDISVLRGHQLTLTCLVISPDDKFIYTGSKDCSIIKWNVKTRKKAGIIPGGRKNTDEKHTGHTSHVTCLAISSDGKFLVSGDQNKLIMVWNPDTLDLIHTFKGHRGPITCLTFRKHSHQLFSASTDRAVKVWTLDEMAYVETLFGHQDSIQAMDSHMRERVITCGGRDNTVRVWKIVEESQLVFNGSGGSLDCVCLIDEERFLTGSDTNQISVWHVSRKKPQCTIKNAHDSDGECWISSIRCLKNTDLMASGSRDGNLKLWKLSKDHTLPECLFSIKVPGFVNDLQFSSDGKFLTAAIGQEHKQGRWWKLKEARNSLVIIKLPRKNIKTIKRNV